MKILLLGPKFYGYCLSLKNHIELNGHDVSYFEYGNLYSLYTRLTKKYLNPNFKASIYNHARVKTDILEELRSSEYDLVIVFKGMIVDAEFLNAIQIKKILWMVDSVFSKYYVNIRRIIYKYDRVFFFEKSDVSKLSNEERFRFLPMGYDNFIYRKINEISLKETDLLFVGSLTDERLEMLEKLIKYYSHLTVKVYGQKTFPTKLMRQNPQVFLNRKLSGKEVNKLYNSARVILNLVNPQNELSFNPRLLEILGSGGTPVTRFTEDTIAEFPYLAGYCYRGKEDIIDAIDYALEHPLETNIDDHVLHHSFSERVKHLIA